MLALERHWQLETRKRRMMTKIFGSRAWNIKNSDKNERSSERNMNGLD